MMNGKVYRNIKTREIVFEEDAKDYALDNIGVKITPKGQNGELTVEQLDIIDILVDWYYDPDWIMEQYEEDEGNVFELINEHCYYDDKFLKEKRID